MQDEFFSISDLTREFDVTTRTIRFYEDEGLIHPVRRGRTRLFRQSDRQLLRNILRGKRLGFSIAEIREIVGMYKAPPGEVGQLQSILGKVRARKAELEQKQRDISDLLSDLKNAEETCEARLSEIGETAGQS
ncbi:MerR family DNA-binding transcriptional regulator [Fulvimarina endophytica]|uniref:MerR family DNA-binding transcriptional regulator n=1 Tax=Fulvimarina endophytica TaxID=2293836 RepID=A0A371X797_9HYPH|nr:MerR family DNA-binding transcriptional regulator [Fulvimarina endophytica]RFC65115.1 MerR family DNA-binding transcriptional regulator [Fulvimarina endophytica]